MNWIIKIPEGACSFRKTFLRRLQFVPLPHSTAGSSPGLSPACIFKVNSPARRTSALGQETGLLAGGRDGPGRVSDADADLIDGVAICGARARQRAGPVSEGHHVPDSRTAQPPSAS